MLVVFDDKGEHVESFEEGRYNLKTGVDGSVILYLASPHNIYQNIQVYSQKYGSSSPTECVIFFGDSTTISTDMPAPFVDLNDQNSLDIPTDSPYFNVHFPVLNDDIDPDAFSCVISTNSCYFTKQNYSSALLPQGVQVPSAYLNTVEDNEIYYFIENNTAGGGLTSDKLIFQAKGIPYKHPSIGPWQNRTLKSRPLLNEGQTAITPSNISDIKFKLKNIPESSGGYTFRTGDSVTFTMFINGYFAGSNVQKNNVFELPPIIIEDPCPENICISLPANILAGYGSNQSHSPGRYEIDYVVKPENSADKSTWSRPTAWLKGAITTSI
ncbi:hypothetical protein [Brucella rhizosphaerae]|uniref:hypothetical protein n=1 Tax=Brucella rhizosphaerae TaxID=571254 RepID=UPI00360FBBA2